MASLHFRFPFRRGDGKSYVTNIRDTLASANLPRIFLDFILLSAKIGLAMIIATIRKVTPSWTKNLIGETVLITGAAHGIGRELAIQLAALGCIIICWDKDIDGNRETMSEVSKIGGEVYGFVVDVSNRREVLDTVKIMKERHFPEVTILINNAAVLYHRPLLQQSPEDIEKTFGVNVLSNFWAIEAFLPIMVEMGRGHIVSMSSMCGICGIANKVSYSASKFAIRGLMEALEDEMRFHPRRPNIRFTTIYPFYVNTGLARDPEYRFPYLFGAISPDYAASEVIKAIRRNYTEHSIPRCLLTLDAINRLVPESVMRIVLDYLADIDRKRKEGRLIYDERVAR